MLPGGAGAALMKAAVEMKLLDVFEVSVYEN
jgi:hypothetical protein